MRTISGAKMRAITLGAAIVAALAAVWAIRAGGDEGAWAAAGDGPRQTPEPTRNHYGTDGPDTLQGGPENEGLWGGPGDRLIGGPGDDTYYLQAPDVVVVEQPGGGTDRIVAWMSVSLEDHPNVENLTVAGDERYVVGNRLDNVLEGGEGGQQIFGNGGRNLLIGGEGSDVFIVYKGVGRDVIGDFQPGVDRIRLKAGFTSFEQLRPRFQQQGRDLLIDLGDGESLMLRNVDAARLSARDFQLELDPNLLGPASFTEEFDRPLSLWDEAHAPNGRWRPDFGYQGKDGFGSYTLPNNNEQQVYTSPFFRRYAGDFPENPFEMRPRGMLTIQARRSNHPDLFGYRFISGLITTRPSFSQTYGYFEMRVRNPTAKGAWPALWLLPTDISWPPEIDIMEMVGENPRVMSTTVHSSVGGHTRNGRHHYIPRTADDFHVYGVLWGRSQIVWYVDGVEVYRAPTPSDAHKPMFLLANLALTDQVAPEQLPAELTIDYVRAYRAPALQARIEAETGRR